MKIFPCVYVVNDFYRITVAADDKFICSLEVGGKRYADDGTGIMRSDYCHSFYVKQNLLEKAGGYTLFVRRFIKKAAYDTEFENEERFSYRLKNRAGSESEINAAYIADVHNDYAQATEIIKAAAKEKDISLIVFGGDLGEIENRNDAIRFCEFMSDLTGGEIPAVYCRGNHDARGGYAEELFKYSGTDGEKGYFAFSYKWLNGVVLDCGEDKNDDFYVYGGANNFHGYRLKESKFLKKILNSEKEINVVFCHVSFMLRDSMFDEFDIERKLYGRWAEYLNGIAPALMVCGHTHKRGYNKPSDKDIQPHNYPVLSGASLTGTKLTGSLISFYKNGIVKIKEINDCGALNGEITVKKGEL